uniref:Uncharacterized protein n=1 Tax=Romanomermis culicivorax TaxID=13658 RepID=A0A915L3Q0_ROMCU
MHGGIDPTSRFDHPSNDGEDDERKCATAFILYVLAMAAVTNHIPRLKIDVKYDWPPAKALKFGWSQTTMKYKPGLKHCPIVLYLTSFDQILQTGLE